MGDERVTTLEELQALRSAACDWRLSRGDVGVYAVLLAHCNAQGLAFPGPTRIGRQASLAVSNVKLSLTRLEQLAYIAIERPGPRKANRYWIQQTPNVPSAKTARIVAATAKELGMPTSLDKNPARATTRPAGRSATRYADRPQLGMRAGHELAFNSQKKGTLLASPSSRSGQERKALDFSRWPRTPSEQTQASWIAMRSRKHATTDQVVVDGMAAELREASLAGHDVEECLAACVSSAWLRFKADWMGKASGYVPLPGEI